jgi:hypothetical protein
MSDNLKNRGAQDRKLVSLTQDWEVKYWTEALGCSVMQLKDAVAAVGHSVEKIKAYIKKTPTDNHL